MYKFRDRVIARIGNKEIEGYIYFVTPSPKEVYVVLTGQNTKPVLIQTSDLSPYKDPEDIKRPRGRPRKDEK